MSVLYEVVQILVASAMVIVTLLTWHATRQSAEATKLQVDAAVSPYLHFKIRPRSHYDDPDIPYSRKSWVRGVGIYVENLGPGPASNFKISCKIIQKDGSTRNYEKKFIEARLLPYNVYTFPSKNWDEFIIKESDDKIIITTEYNDRLNNFHKQESFELEIEDRHFQEYPIIPSDVKDIDELKPEEKFSIDVKYKISTKSDWTIFSIESEEKWEDQTVKILLGEESLTNPPIIDSRKIHISKESYDTSPVEIELDTKLIIPKSKINQNIKYLIKKGDIEHTIVDIVSKGIYIEKLTNTGSITYDSENYKEYDVPIKKHLK